MSNQAELYACLYAKEFPTQAMLRLRSEFREKPCVVMDGEPPLQSVCSFNSKAHNLGVARGMTQVEVETFPSVSVLTRSPSEEATTKAAMLECAGSFSPRVEDRSDGDAFLCVIDIAGTEKLFGPAQTLAQTLLRRVQTLGIAISIAVSGNFHVAICLARGMSERDKPTVVTFGEESSSLAPLSLSVLGLSESHAETFALWGIHTLGMLAALPETELIARIGQEGKRLRQLARGEMAHLFLPVEPTLTLEERIELDTPVELLDSLLFVVGVMLEHLIVRAAGRMLALASATITLSLEGGLSHTRTVRPALPSNNRQLWIKLIHLDLEAHPPPALILSLILAAEPGIAVKEQLGLFSPQIPEPMCLDVTLARIRAIVGEGCVGRPVLKDTHRPDDFRIEPFSIPAGPTSVTIPKRSTVALRQLRPSESVSITLRNLKPTTFFFREKRYSVEQAYGPWHASGNWWNLTLWGREQWDVVARCPDGSLLCCCLVRDLTQNSWQMTALYD